MLRKLFVIFTCFSLLCLAGCWSSRELNELAIAVAIGIDKKGDHLELTVQIINPGVVGAQKQAQGTPISTFTVEAKSVAEALRKLTTQEPRIVYMAHLRIVVLSEEVAREGIAEELDFFARHHQLRTDYFFIIAKKTKAKNVLKVMTTLEQIPANYMFSSVEKSQDQWAPTTAVRLNEIIMALTSEGREAVMTGMRIKGKKGEGDKLSNIEDIDIGAILEIEGIGVFKKDKLVGWLNQDESKGFNYIESKVKSTIGHIPCEKEKGNVIGVEVRNIKTNVKGKVKNGNPVIHLKINGEADIADVKCAVDLKTPKAIKKLEKQIEKQIKELVSKSINTARGKYKSDIYGFGEAIHRDNPQEWKKMKKNWDKVFAEKLEVKIESKIQIRRVGTVTESFIEELRK